MSDLLARIVPPVDQVGEDGKPKPSRMRPEEQRVAVAVGVANLFVCLGLIVAAGSLGPDTTAPASRMLAAGGALASIGLIPAARYGNRFIAGFVAVAAGFLGPAGLLSPFAIAPHYAFAMWMMLRQNKATREAMAEKRAVREAGGPRPARSRRGASTPKQPDGRLAPGASKRYTPPRPKRKPAPKPVDKAKAKDTAEAE